jgi:hypothetical protein
MQAITNVGGDWIRYDYSCTKTSHIITTRWIFERLRYDNISADKGPVIYQQFVRRTGAMKLTMVEGPDGWEFVG